MCLLTDCLRKTGANFPSRIKPKSTFYCLGVDDENKLIIKDFDNFEDADDSFISIEDNSHFKMPEKGILESPTKLQQEEYAEASKENNEKFEESLRFFYTALKEKYQGKLSDSLYLKCLQIAEYQIFTSGDKEYNYYMMLELHLKNNIQFALEVSEETKSVILKSLSKI